MSPERLEPVSNMPMWLRLRNHLASTVRELLQKAVNLSRDWSAVDNVLAQKLLMERYRSMPPGQHAAFRDVGWGLHSQHDEDGILLYIFSRIGIQTYRSIELCAGNGIECNTANLLLNHRWNGLLVDGSAENVAKARKYYQRRLETRHWPPDVVKAWLTRENVNETILNAGYSGEIDLLSLDIDGMDYWIWEVMDAVSPRIVVLEYNHLLGPDVSVSVPYDPNFVAEFSQYGSDYAGASLGAFTKLSKRKKYRFIGTNAIGTNAFFARRDIPVDLLPESRVEDAFSHPRAQFGMRVRYKTIKDKHWVEV